MTSFDWLPILTKILGPQCIELSHPPTQVVYCMGAFSHNVITEEAAIGTAAPFKMLDFFNEVKRRKSNGGGSGLASAKQIITEKMGAELRMLGFTNEELSKLKPEAIQNLLASCCADPVEGFEGFVPPCDLTSAAHRRALIEFWSLPLEDLGEGISDQEPEKSPLPDFAQYCEAACIKLWGEPNKRTTDELIWKGGKTFNPSKRVWYDHSAKRGGSTLELVDYHKGRPKRDLRGARFFEVWREANAMGIVPEEAPPKSTAGGKAASADDHTDPPAAGPRAIDIPPALKPLTEHKRWLIWRWEQKENGKRTKVPYQGHATSRKAVTTDPQTWCYFKSATSAYAEGRCDGVGYVLTDSNISAIDIDDCRNATTGAMHPWAAEQIAHSNSYAEVTPSNEGVRIIGLSNDGTPLNNPYAVPDTNVSGELYRRPPGRYITITGKQIGAATELKNIDAQIDNLVSLLVTRPVGNGGVRPKQAGGQFGVINERALANLDKWAKQLFPTAKRTRNGGYRIKSADLGRGFAEDLSLTPQGIKYFGVHDMGDPRQGRRTPVELVAEWQHIEWPQAAEWLQKTLDSTEQEPPPPPEPPDETEPTDAQIEITRLAKLPLLEYGQQRLAVAKKLKIPVGILEKVVYAERVQLGLAGDGEALQGSAVTFEDIEPWSEPVDGVELLNEVATTIRSYVVMSDHERDICALWTLHSYLIKHFKISPKLSIKSVVKQCGKTTLLEALSYLVYRAWMTGSITVAALFRVIEMWHPTLLIDEVDTFVGDNEELRGILNQSHRYDGCVTRTVGDEHEPRRFSVYAPVALSGIGGLADTLADRSVTTVLKRRRPNEPIAQLRIGRMGHLHDLRRRIVRWVADHEEHIATRDPVMPARIINRDADNWHVLLAIADEVAGEWPARARKAAEQHQIAVVGDDASRLELLLGDIRDVFDGLVSDKDRISSAHLIERLVEIVPRPWAEYGRTGKPLTQNGLARLLKPLRIAPEQIRFETGENLKGYYRHSFEEAWDRFLPQDGDSQLKQRNKCDEMGTSATNQSETSENYVSVRKCEKSNNDGICFGVSDGRGDEPPPSMPCAHCGRLDGSVFQMNDLGRATAFEPATGAPRNAPTVYLHADCAQPFFAARANGTCAQCGQPGGNMVATSDGLTHRLHRECEKAWIERRMGEEGIRHA